MKKVSSKYIIQRAIDDIGEMAEQAYKTNKELLANWIYDAMRIIGNFPMLEDKVQEYDVQEYEVFLPCDYIQEIVVKNKSGAPIKHYDKNFDTIMNTKTLRYKNNGEKLIFNQKEAEVTLYYKGISFDEEGYVIIADDEFDSQTRAIVQYIAMMLCKVRARKGDASAMQFLQIEMQEWHRLCANAGAHRYMPKTLAERAKLGNIQRAFVLNYNDYYENFNSLNKKHEKYL